MRRSTLSGARGRSCARAVCEEDFFGILYGYTKPRGRQHTFSHEMYRFSANGLRSLAQEVWERRTEVAECTAMGLANRGGGDAEDFGDFVEGHFLLPA